jgi:hypothetical protein
MIRVLAILAAAALAGCQYQPPRIWADPQTGCQYLIASGAHEQFMTPRLGRDGHQLCGAAR